MSLGHFEILVLFTYVSSAGGRGGGSVGGEICSLATTFATSTQYDVFCLFVCLI